MGKRIGVWAMADRERQRRFEGLLREHQRIVFKVAGAYARSQPDRDDLAQEIAAQLWRSFGRFDERRAKFSTWMDRVALNVAISHARAAERSGAKHFESLDEAHLATIAGAGGRQDESMEWDERIAALHAFIARLDPLNRALVLLYLEDRSYAEIAEVLGISETNVATKINRIKHRMRGQMAPAATEEVKDGTR
jgi:RNA polymerase sigma-70 factor (ECF subfamily)